MNAARRWIGYWLLFWLGVLLQTAALADLRAPFYEAQRGKQVIYVLGTLHVGQADFYPFRPEIETALEKSTRFFLEIDHDASNGQQKLAEAMLCNPPCLQASLSEAEWSTLARRLGNKEAALREISRIRPWAAAIVLSLADYASLGLTAENGVEAHVTARARKGKNLVGLETVDEQIRLFTEMPPAEQKELLVQWLNMSAKERLVASRELVELWKGGDAEAMHAWYKKMEKRYSSSPETAESFDRRFLVARNRAFVERLLAQIGNAPGPVLLAVGALHLGGPEGVLTLLEKQGFTIKAR